jgi:hypothetical protein
MLPANGLRAYINGGLSSRGIKGDYASSSLNDNDFVNALEFTESSVRTFYYSGAAKGNAVRCIAE